MAETSSSINLSNLSSVPGARKKRVRVGRGIGSGMGKTAGRGVKGQNSRRGKGKPRGFEGGQIPLQRRLPKFGFTRAFRKVFEVVNMADIDSRFQEGEEVNQENLFSKGLLRSQKHYLKILGTGDLTKKLSVKAHKFSKSAIEKINHAGGTVEEIKIGSR